MKDWILDVSGENACFTRPEMKVERVSYDVITPSAARAIFEAILWKPAIKWHITKVEVLSPIRRVSIRRNEVGKKAIMPSANQIDRGDDIGIYVEDERQQRAGLFLRDVRYRLHAWFEFIPLEMRRYNRTSGEEIWADTEENEMLIREDDTPAKYAAMFERRTKKGQCFHRPYLGCREFPCFFSLVDEAMLEQGPEPIVDSYDLGWMLYDLDYANPEEPIPEFFYARMENGVVITDRRHVEIRK